MVILRIYTIISIVKYNIPIGTKSSHYPYPVMELSEVMELPLIIQSWITGIHGDDWGSQTSGRDFLHDSWDGIRSW